MFKESKKLIDGRDAKKSQGSDNINPGILKLISNDAANFLEAIFKIRWQPRKYQMTGKWRILPLFTKQGAKGNLSNYRPVSLTSIPCKTS